MRYKFLQTFNNNPNLIEIIQITTNLDRWYRSGLGNTRPVHLLFSRKTQKIPIKFDLVVQKLNPNLSSGTEVKSYVI